MPAHIHYAQRERGRERVRNFGHFQDLLPFTGKLLFVSAYVSSWVYSTMCVSN